MKYYKKENVEREIVEEYKIIKLKCDHCGGTIETGDKYAAITEIPKSFIGDIRWREFCAECLDEYIKNATYNWDNEEYPKIEVELKVFEPYNERWVDEVLDKEDVEEDTNNE